MGLSECDGESMGESGDGAYMADADDGRDERRRR